LIALGGKLLSAGKTLGSKIIDGIRAGLSAAGQAVVGLANAVKNAINDTLHLPLNIGPFKIGPKSFGPWTAIPRFERGGVTPGGTVMVGEGGAELVTLPRGSRVHSNSESKRMMGSALPKTVVLRIGSRDFLAYVEEIADNRIDAADNLAWQGA
jgi:hypothetical protein